MNKETIIEQMQQYLAGDITRPVFEVIAGMDDLQKFYCRTAKRLAIARELQKKSSDYQDDFLIALRDFLLVFETSIKIENIEIEDGNPYAIKKDNNTGKYFVTFQFPEGVSSELAEQAFMRNLVIEDFRKKDYNLTTDSLIYSVTGFKQFKTMSQKMAVYGALNTPGGYTTLVSLPTGGGKSLITQMMAYQSDGLTVVVVLTISLADDQLIAAKQVIKRNTVEQEIFSYRSGVQIKPILNAIQNRTARLLFISPEALMNNQAFDNIIKVANKQHYMKNIVIDEAHIVVDWGASFRVDYQCLEAWRKRLLLTNPDIKTILLSATFESKCVDVLKKLFSDGKRWIEVRCDALRHEPRYILLKENGYKNKDKKTIELVQKLPHPMIIYVARPDDAERIKKLLANHGIKNVCTYTGLTNNDLREQLLKGWKADKFEIMVATSAFGVGVDKPDVRTVLHLYVPQNPNAYYQELGRGGRDQLPCLSVMCIYADDLKFAFQRISKRVMTTEKIIGRWDSMYNNKSSIRDGAIIHINTGVRPNYHDKDEWDDRPVSDADMNWNIYVLLLFRRYDLIEIVDITNDSGIYIFSIKIKEELLRKESDVQTNMLEQIRAEEWNYYNGAYLTMEKSIKNSESECWSEMFFETYDKVYEYCAGCNVHKNRNNGDAQVFPLKKNIKGPVLGIDLDQKQLFESQDELIIFSKPEERIRVIEYLERQRIACLVATKQQIQDVGYFENVSSGKSTYIIDPAGVKELLKKGNYYYISGMVAILYPDRDEEVFEMYRMATQYLCHKAGIYVVHILASNTYFPAVGKNIADLIEGRVVAADVLYS